MIQRTTLMRNFKTNTDFIGIGLKNLLVCNNNKPGTVVL